MAITKTIEIDIESSKSEKKVEGLITQFTDLGKEASESIKKIEKGVENTEKSTGKLAKGFRAAGIALKAMGVGLVIEAFNILKDLFQSNQKIADVFGTSMKALSVVFNDLFNFIFDNVDSVKDFFKAIFEDPIGSLKQLGQLIKENIIERFKSALEVAGFLSDALVNLFKGDFDAALKSVKEAGKEMIDVFTGVDDTFGKVGKLADAVGKYAGEVWNSAAALQAQENAAKRAEAIQAGLVEQYDRQAEKLRQLRDDDTLSIEERIKANEELGKVLDEQEKAMLKQAQLQVQAAANQFNLNKSIENEVALINARNNVKAVEAQIEGFRSEQIVNRIALEKESLELAKSRAETDNELAINQKLFEAERLKDEGAKLEAQKLAIENERTLEMERLQNNIALYKEGTQARIDAENEYALRKQELDNAIILKEDEIAQQRIDRQKELNEQLQLAEDNLQNAKRQALSDSLDILQQFAGKNKTIALGILAVQKGLAVAEVISNASKGIAVSTSNLSLVPAILPPGVPNPAYPFALASHLKNVAANKISAATSIATILAQTVSSAKGVLSGGSGGASGSAPSGVGGGSATAPQFNVVGNSGVNQIAETLGQQQPVQAYVVANNVTTAQSMDRNIIQNASLG
jgi:hypothetical protein